MSLSLLEERVLVEDVAGVVELSPEIVVKNTGDAVNDKYSTSAWRAREEIVRDVYEAMKQAGYEVVKR